MRDSDRNKLAELQPQVRPLFLAWLQNVEQIRGIEMRVIEAYRSSERQNTLYEIGRKAKIVETEGGGIETVWKKIGPTVTNARGQQSYHFWRVAIDAAPKDYLAVPDWNPDGPYWDIMRAEARKVNLETPMSWDQPHVEYREGHHWREWIESFPSGRIPDDFFRGIGSVRVESKSK